MSRRYGTNNKVFVILLAMTMIFVGLYTFFGSNGLMEIIRRKHMDSDLKADLEQVKRENLLLRSKIWAMKNKPFEVERIARERLFMIKPGEKIYLVEEK